MSARLTFTYSVLALVAGVGCGFLIEYGGLDILNPGGLEVSTKEDGFGKAYTPLLYTKVGPYISTSLADGEDKTMRISGYLQYGSESEAIVIQMTPALESIIGLYVRSLPPQQMSSANSIDIVTRHINRRLSLLIDPPHKVGFLISEVIVE